MLARSVSSPLRNGMVSPMSKPASPMNGPLTNISEKPDLSESPERKEEEEKTFTFLLDSKPLPEFGKIDDDFFENENSDEKATGGEVFPDSPTASPRKTTIQDTVSPSLKIPPALWDSDMLISTDDLSLSEGTSQKSSESSEGISLVNLAMNGAVEEEIVLQLPPKHVR